MINKKPLQLNAIEAIKFFKDEHWKNDNLDVRYPNLILRDDVLRLLGEYCTIVFYPLEDEKNHGFHINNLPGKNKQLQEFVFINTAQTIEKQVFTAAHELGHIWKISESVIDKCELSSSDDLDDKITNRFAAILLMPEDSFKTKWTQAFSNLKLSQDDSPQRILELLLQLIATFMYEYCVPYKAVIYRFLELDLVPENFVSLLLDESQVRFQDYIRNTLDSIFIEQGYIKFKYADKRKHIHDYSKLLDAAEATSTIPLHKIKKIREKFELPSSDKSFNVDAALQLQLHEFMDIYKDKDTE